MSEQPRPQIDGKIVAFGVLDIVPTGVSSVYFCYDPKGPFGHVKWGKVGSLQTKSSVRDPLADFQTSCAQISALREIALVKDMQQAGLRDFRYEYLGRSPCSNLGNTMAADELDRRLLCPLLHQGEAIVCCCSASLD